MRARLLASCFGLAAAICFLVAYLNRDYEVKGAYFSQDLGDGISLFDPFDPWDGYLWLGAGTAFVLSAALVLILSRIGGRS